MEDIPSDYLGVFLAARSVFGVPHGLSLTEISTECDILDRDRSNTVWECDEGKMKNRRRKPVLWKQVRGKKEDWPCAQNEAVPSWWNRYSPAPRRGTSWKPQGCKNVFPGPAQKPGDDDWREGMRNLDVGP